MHAEDCIGHGTIAKQIVFPRKLFAMTIAIKVSIEKTDLLHEI
jgi:hypothetical protein